MTAVLLLLEIFSRFRAFQGEKWIINQEVVLKHFQICEQGVVDSEGLI